MSIGSFFGHIGNFFKTFFNKLPDWFQTASAALKLATPLVTGLLSQFAGVDISAEAQGVIAEVQTDFAVAANLLSQAHAGANVTAQLTAVLEAIRSNLAGILTAAHIKNPDLLAKVTAAVNLIDGEIAAIISVLPKAK